MNEKGTNRVREIRKALGMSQGALGEAAGLHQVQVSYIEIGRTKKPRIKTMQAIAEALGCSVADAFPDAGPPAPKPVEVLKGRHCVCQWCGRRYLKDQAAVLSLAGKKIYEAGNLRCLAEYIVDNTDSKGNWKKHRTEGL